MPTSTTNYELIKPGTDDPILIEQLNTNADIIDNALKENADALGGKVDKETGKGLSTNDFTTVEKTKLDDLAEIKSIGTGLNLDDNGELTATGGGSGGTTNYNDLSNKPQINGNTLSGNKTSAQLGLASASDIPTVPITAIQKNGTGITPVSGTVNITVPTQASDINAATATQGDKADTAIQGIKVNSSTVNPDVNKVVNITVPTTAADVSALPASTKYAAALSLTINSSTFVMTGQLKDQNGDNLGTAQTIDLPLESVVVGGSYNSQTKKVVLTLQNGNTIEFSVADLVSGLQTELSASNKLNPAYINYDSAHRAVSDTEKSTWNSKQNALSSAQLAAVNSGIDSEKVDQIETNKNNISTVFDANGKKQLIPNFGVLTSDNVTYTQSGTSITVTGSKNNGEPNYVNIINAPYEYFGLKANDKIVVKNSDAIPVYVGIGFDNGGYTANPTLVIGTQELTLPSDKTYMYIRIGLLNSVTSVSKTIQPLVCDKKLYDISQTVSQYAMSNAELTTKEQVNENNISKDEDALVELVDNGAKNTIDITPPTGTDSVGITYTPNADKSFTVQGTASDLSQKRLFTISAEDAQKFNGMVLSGCPSGGGNSTYRLLFMRDGSPYTTYAADYGDGAVIQNVPAVGCRVFLYIESGKTVNMTFKPMICTKAAWDISHEYQPYRPPYQELYEMVKALQAQLANQ